MGVRLPAVVNANPGADAVQLWRETPGRSRKGDLPTPKVAHLAR